MIKTTIRLKKCFAVLRARREVFNQRGQVAVFYALLIPIFLFVGGVGLDLGWYYLNVSRLQNAADASVLVGAKTLTKTHDLFKGKSYKIHLVDKFPKNNPVKDNENKPIRTTNGDEEALKYAKKNLADNSLGYVPPNLLSVAQAANDESIKDGYTRGNNEVKMTTGLYQEGEDYFYVIGLSENIHHFFIGFLDDMNAGVVAVAKLTKNTDTEDTPKIVFDANEGMMADSEGKLTESVEIKEIKNLPITIKLPNGYANPTREGYSFTGWSTKSDGSGENVYGRIIETEPVLKEFFETYDPSSSEENYDYKKQGIVTLYAQWRENDPPPKPKYIILDANGGTLDGNDTDPNLLKIEVTPSLQNGELKYNAITLPKGTDINLKKDDYEFELWNGDNGKIYFDGNEILSGDILQYFKDNPTADKIVLKAQWRLKNSALEDTIPDSGQGIQIRTDHSAHYKTEHFFIGADNIGKPIAFSQNVQNFYGKEWDTDGVTGMTFGPNLKKGFDPNITP